MQSSLLVISRVNPCSVVGLSQNNTSFPLLCSSVPCSALMAFLFSSLNLYSKTAPCVLSVLFLLGFTGAPVFDAMHYLFFLLLMLTFTF